MNIPDEIHQLERLERRLHELRQSNVEGVFFDWDDVEYLRLLARKLELGYGSGFNAAWFSETAEKLSKTLEALDKAVEQMGVYATYLGYHEGVAHTTFESGGEWCAHLMNKERNSK